MFCSFWSLCSMIETSLYLPTWFYYFVAHDWHWLLFLHFCYMFVSRKCSFVHFEFEFWPSNMDNISLDSSDNESIFIMWEPSPKKINLDGPDMDIDLDNSQTTVVEDSIQRPIYQLQVADISSDEQVYFFTSYSNYNYLSISPVSLLPFKFL